MLFTLSLRMMLRLKFGPNLFSLKLLQKCFAFSLSNRKMKLQK